MSDKKNRARGFSFLSLITHHLSLKFGDVPVYERRAEEQADEGADAEEDAEGEEHLHVATPALEHQADAGERPRKDAEENRQERQRPAEVRADHEHHLDVAQPHRL